MKTALGFIGHGILFFIVFWLFYVTPAVVTFVVAGALFSPEFLTSWWGQFVFWPAALLALKMADAFLDHPWDKWRDYRRNRAEERKGEANVERSDLS